MKLFNNYFLLTILLGCFFTACSDSDEYTPGAPANTGENVYFAETNESTPVLGTDDNEFSVIVSRTNGTSAESVPLIVVTPHDSIFTVPSTVDFASGETSKNVVIKTSDKMRMFKEYALSIAVPEEYTHQYVETTVYPRMELVVLKEDYKPYAKGMYTSEFFGDAWEMELEYSPILDLYRFSDCWVEGYDVTFSWNNTTVAVNGNTALATGYMHPDYGMVNATPIEDGCGYDETDRMFTFSYTWTVSAGSFGDYADYFEIAEVY